MYAVAIGADRELDVHGTGLEKFAVVGLFIALNNIRINLEFQHLVFVAMTRRTEFYNSFDVNCSLVFWMSFSP